MGQCNLKRWPAPPTVQDAGGNLDLVFAMRTIDLGESDLSAGPKVGYDLDGVCTCPEIGSCAGDEKFNEQRCDGPGGTDNNAARLFASLALIQKSLTSENLSKDAEEGDFAVLVRIRNYNGEANDDQVTVSLHPSRGFAQDPCNASNPLPAWDGSDRWPISASSVTKVGEPGTKVDCEVAGSPGYDIDTPTTMDSNAYINDYRLVANVAEAGLLLPTNDGIVPIKLKQGLVSARLDDSSGSWALVDGSVTGRWPLKAMFGIIGLFTSDDTPICTDHFLYTLMKNSFCRFVDIRDDLGGATQSCNALSFGWAFGASLAKIGVVLEDPTAQSGCPAETDPANDTCTP